MKSLDIFSLPLDGTHLIEASAGSGKTYTLCTLYLRHIIEKGRTPIEILMVTFTRASTNDLKQKITQRLEDIHRQLSFSGQLDEEWVHYLKCVNISIDVARRRIENAQKNFDHASIYTIHGFCNMLIRQYPQETGYFGAYKVLDDDDSGFEKRRLIDYWREYLGKKYESDEHVFFQKIVETQGNIEHLNELTHRWLQRPYCTLVEKDIPPFHLWYKNTSHIFQQLKREWTREKTILCDFVVHLRKNTFSDDKVNKAFKAIDNYLSRDSLPHEFSDDICLFGKQKVNNGKKKNAPDIELLSFGFIDDLASQYQTLQMYLSNFYKDILTKVRDDYRQYRFRKRTFFYDDLLHIVYHTLTKPTINNSWKTHLVDQFPVVMVDEFQDTDPLQFQIFQAIYGDVPNTHWVMVGDPKQAIYSFRGADIDTYFYARDHVICKQDHYLLEYNYRSHQDIIGSINRLFGFKKSFKTCRIDYHPAIYPDNKAIDHYCSSFSRFAILQIKKNEKKTKNIRYQKLSLATAELLQKLLGLQIGMDSEDKRLVASDAVVIVRTSEQASFVAKACQEKGIPVTMFSQQNLFKIKQAEELIFVLEAIDNPFLSAKICTALSTSWFMLIENNHDENTIFKWIEVFHHANHISQKNSPIAAIKWLFNEVGIFLNMVKNSRNIISINRLYQLVDELYHGKDRIENMSLSQLIDKLKKEYLYSSKKVAYWCESEHQGGVSIATIHYCKGLEFEVVICPFLDEMGNELPKKPTFIAVDQEKYEHSMELYIPKLYSDNQTELQETYKQKEKEENMRLLYVALTRAKSACYIIHFATEIQQMPPLSFLINKLKNGSDDNIQYDFETYIDGITSKQKPSLALPPTEKMTPIFPQGIIKRKQLTTYKLISYSHISAKLSQQRDNMQNNYNHTLSSINSDRSFVGREAGSCIHKILEEIDFCISLDKQEKIISDALLMYGFDDSYKKESIQLIEPLYNCEFNDGNNQFVLPMIDSNHYQREMDFLFFCQNIPYSQEDVVIPMVTPQKNDGFLIRGFMDQFIQFNNRFYVIDYKTDLLGNQQGGYQRRNIEEHIQNYHYNVQCDFYTLAAHLHLKMRLKDNYNYNHFGGMFYVFLRGLVFDREELPTSQESVVFFPSSPDLIHSLEKKYHPIYS